jgi:hypothetical protein
LVGATVFVMSAASVVGAVRINRILLQSKVVSSVK